MIESPEMFPCHWHLYINVTHVVVACMLKFLGEDKHEMSSYSPGAWSLDLASRIFLFS